ncbi:hypothetical protein ALTERO38_51830 [Alteromonas sp. 38]|nr:hypothetical protein ALTER154_80379 [Alteromonas sp. 154]VXB88687.1 hypothetical protein ALTERO38_51830 [Alteromonas sp. 38]
MNYYAHVMSYVVIIFSCTSQRSFPLTVEYAILLTITIQRFNRRFYSLGLHSGSKAWIYSSMFPFKIR